MSLAASGDDDGSITDDGSESGTSLALAHRSQLQRYQWRRDSDGGDGADASGGGALAVPSSNSSVEALLHLRQSFDGTSNICGSGGKVQPRTGGAQLRLPLALTLAVAASDLPAESASEAAPAESSSSTGSAWGPGGAPIIVDGSCGYVYGPPRPRCATAGGGTSSSSSAWASALPPGADASAVGSLSGSFFGGGMLSPTTADLCHICCAAVGDAVLLECGHGGMCAPCCVRMRTHDGRCPICREVLESIVSVGRASCHASRLVPCVPVSLPISPAAGSGYYAPAAHAVEWVERGLRGIAADSNLMNDAARHIAL